MTIVQLEYLLALEKYGSFVTAAEHCFVTQPTLSMQVQKLEEELDVKLFDRSKQPVIPTETGKKILHHARRILDESTRIKELVKEERNEISGELRLGIIPTLAPYLLPLFVSEFINAYPLLRLSVTELTTEQIIAALKNDELDCGLLATPLKETALFETPLFYEPFVAYVANQNPLFKLNALQKNDLDSADLWILSEGHCMRNQVLNICSKKSGGSHANFDYQSGSIETLKRLVELNKGATILPELAIADLSQKQRNRVRYFKSPEPVREISLVTHRSFVKKKLLDILATHVQQHVPEKMLHKLRKKIVGV